MGDYYDYHHDYYDYYYYCLYNFQWDDDCYDYSCDYCYYEYCYYQYYQKNMITTTIGASSGGRAPLQPPILRGQCLPVQPSLNGITGGRGDETTTAKTKQKKNNKKTRIYIYVSTSTTTAITN